MGLNLPLRPLGQTGLKVSPLGLGTVKIGRNEKVKYGPFELPSDEEVVALLHMAVECGINLIDTAPAYGIAEKRLGKLLGPLREKFVLITKVGEQFINGQSHYDFSREGVRSSVEKSLRRLRTDCLDCVLVHCTANDVQNLTDTPVLEVLRELKKEGDILSYGASTMSIEGGLIAAQHTDIVMVAYNAGYTAELPVIEAAARNGKGILIKKGFFSGNLQAVHGKDPVETYLRAALALPGQPSLIVGTVNPDHLRQNAAFAKRFFLP